MKSQVDCSSSSLHRMAPLIRFTLVSLYLALVLPLPVLAPAGFEALLALLVLLGLALVVAATSEQVRVDAEHVSVGHPPWCSWFLRRGWQLRWDEIEALVPRTTSQGGRVFYVRGRGQRHHLLPQRITDFDGFLQHFHQASGLDTSAVKRLTPAWTYQLLGLLCGALLVSELLGWYAASSGLWIAPLIQPLPAV